MPLPFDATLKDIILTDIMRLYAARRGQFYHNGREFKFWETNEKRKLKASELEEREKQLPSHLETAGKLEAQSDHGRRVPREEPASCELFVGEGKWRGCEGRAISCALQRDVTLSLPTGRNTWTRLFAVSAT